MKYVTTSALALTIAAGAASAGGIERSNNDYGFLFSENDRLQLSFSHVMPEVSGTYTAALTAAGGGEDDTGNMANDYTNYGFAYKNNFTEKLTFGLYVNNPYGAGAEYTQGIYSGLTADWDSDQIALVGKYRVTDRVSVFAGTRYVESDAQITIPDLLVRSAVGRNAQGLGAQAQALGAEAAALGAQAQAAGAAGDAALAQELGAQAAALGAEAQTLGARAQTLGGAAQNFGTSMEFNASGDRVGDWGAILGVAYEIPDIALRVALSWQSEIEHNFSTSETIPGLGIDADNGETKVTMPQTVALDVQSGIAPGTLVFGQVKWVEWSKWEVRTPEYEGATGGAVTGFDNDRVTWTLGIGRQFTEDMSGFAQVKYEAQNGDEVSRLSPRDGFVSFGVGGQYKMDNMTLRGGVEYAWVGEAEDGSGTKFDDNSALGFGVSLTVDF
ncbi:outer membrane protein transport protein [Marivita hallyeonensis]|uniref:Long-chain fatty acid transport protein n=1 Tax=Marivita hallyeonensis TaxID=996342 RepID=A0A1M5R779_9RHOB|nr:outer membrane protein transport protein [Marivita hallyeonensis]SHH21906.1 Long-chain fatty acid transport protein [Marivita hallyeonensis]